MLFLFAGRSNIARFDKEHHDNAIAQQKGFRSYRMNAFNGVPY